MGARDDDECEFRLADERTSPADLSARADVIAQQIVGAPALAVVAEPTAHSVAAILAGMRCGIPVVPLSADSNGRERSHILTDSGATVIAEAGDVRDVASTPSATAGPAPTDAALILYTSGTTGAPKGVPITRNAIDACLDGLADAWHWTPDDHLVHGLPLHHVHGLVLGILGPLRIGARLTHTGRPTPAGYAAAGGTLYFGVPTVWGRIAADATAARGLRSARLLVSGSAALPASVFSRIRDLTGHCPVERYGMTETLITVSARADAERRPGTVGEPLPGIMTRIVDDTGTAVPHDGASMGELLVKGPTVFSGYLRHPDDAPFTSDGWFRTGDVGTIAADGIHRIVGRASTDLIKSGGYRIGAGEIEDALLSHPAVTEAAVVGIADDDLGQRVVAFVVASGVDEPSLVAHVAEQLSWHKRPRAVVFLDSLPRNSMGKVEKARLQGMAGPTMTSPTRG